MAAAYAALVSLSNTLETIQNHPNPPITLDNQQVQSLLEKVTFLQEFLDNHSHNEAYPIDGLEGLIRDVTHAIEDAIESHIVDQIVGSANHVEGKSNSFYQDLRKAIEDMHFIKKEATQIKEEMQDYVRQQHTPRSMPDGSLSSPSRGQKKCIMVGCDDVLIGILDKLTGQKSGRHIIPIVGMAGIGKTTLALKAYEHASVVKYFDIRIWVTVSQNFKARKILLEILFPRDQESREVFSHMSEDQIGQKIHKNFFGRRYLLILDDMWSSEVWDEIRRFFPDNNNGSRVTITTRISNVAIQLTSSSGIQMNLLTEGESWRLFCNHVFGEDDCPLDWEEIGKAIVKNCEGLPLSIAVIGGLLAKSDRTKQHWAYVAQNLNAIVNLEDDEHCFKILQMSYKQLPIHLKPCFLYMGVFSEDTKIYVSWLVKQLAAEGFVKPVDGKFIEVVAKEYIKDLVDRNLILVDKWGYAGNIKVCKIHDLLRDFCLREAQKEKFLYIMGEHNICTNGERRIVVQGMTSKSMSMEEQESQASGGPVSALIGSSFISKVYDILRGCPLREAQEEKFLYTKGEHNFCTDGERGMTSMSMEEQTSQASGGFLSAPLARSFIFNHEDFDPNFKFRLLRVWKEVDKYPYWGETKGKIFNFEEFYTLRYLAYATGFSAESIFCSSIHLLWNLQTLIFQVNTQMVIAPVEIWKMPQLRHIKVGGHLQLPSPPNERVTLQNLQTLSRVAGFKCSNKVVERIPHIKKLVIAFGDKDLDDCSSYNLNNLERLCQLEHLSCRCYRVRNKYLKQSLTFPCSLKKLVLFGFNLSWKDITAKVGLLPHLAKLQLGNIRGRKWKPVEGQFLCLKFLSLSSCKDLESWEMDSTHFPLLESLKIWKLRNLLEIPSVIGEIPTLKHIDVGACNASTVLSAKKIVGEQEELGNFDLVISTLLAEDQSELQSLASLNFQVRLRC